MIAVKLYSENKRISPKYLRRRRQPAPAIELLEQRVLYSADLNPLAQEAMSDSSPAETLSVKLSTQAAPAQTAITTTAPEGPIVDREATPAHAESQLESTEPDGQDFDSASTVSISDSSPGYDRTGAQIDQPESIAEKVHATTAGTDATVTEVIFVDYRTPDAEAVLEDIERNAAPDSNFELVLLNADDPGIQIVSEYIAQLNSIDAIHFISHGADGTVQLGTDVLNEETLVTHAGAVHQWQHFLSQDADILIYGCNVSATEHGQAFVDRLASMTGADVAASDDATGPKALGADWQLEYTVGSIHTEIALNPLLRNTLSATLASVTIDNTNDVLNGDISSISNLLLNDGGDGISLREAVIAANNDPIADTIILGPGTYVLDEAGSGNNGDLDISTQISIQGAGVLQTSLSTVITERLLHVNTGGDLTITDITLMNGEADRGGGIRVDSGGSLLASNVVLLDNYATTSGGAIYAEGDTVLNRVSLVNNESASLGGAISVFSGITDLTNTTLSGNTATNSGGGIHVSGGTLNVDHSTIANNEATAGSGGGIRIAAGTVGFSDTIIFDNTDGEVGTNADISGEIDSDGYNIIGETLGLISINDMIGVDPLLEPLTQDTASGQYHQGIDADSVAHNAATGSVAAKDIRGIVRDDGSPDIGAYEFTPNISIIAPGPVVTAEDTVLVFAGANAIGVIDGIKPDAPIRVSLNVGNGVLNLASLAGVSITGGSNGSNSLVVEGLESDINGAINGLIYTPDTNYSGPDTLSIQVSSTSGLAGHYLFDGDDGVTATDHAGGDDTGTFVGDAQLVTDPLRGEVIDFDGNGDALHVSGRYGDPEDITVAAWVNLDTANHAEIIDVGHSVVIWYRSGVEELRGSYYDGAWNTTAASINLVASGWTHVAYTVDSTNNIQTLYIDGVEVNSNSSTTPISYTNAADSYFGIRADGNNDRDMDGQLDDIRVYSRALSAEEIEALANGQGTATDSVAITVDAVNDKPEFSVPGPSEFDSLAVATDADGANGTVTADMDGDGDDDIVAALTGSDTIVWYQHNADGSFTAQTVASGVLGVRQVGVADFDGDGDQDIVSASKDDNTIAWYESDGAGNFIPHLITNDALGAHDVAVGDLDGDGYSDVVSASSIDNTVSWFAYDPGTGAFSTEQILSSTLDDARTVEIADFNDDGHLDVLVGSGNGAINSIRLFINNGNTSPTFNGSFVAGGLGVINGLAAADINGDGILDIAVAETTGDKVSWYENNGSENFTRHEAASGVDDPQSVNAADIDGDGDIDLVVPLQEANTLVWYENDGSGGFNSQTLSNSLTDVTDASIVDIDDDGDTDIVVSVSGDDSVLIYNNLSENLNERGVARPAFIENGAPVVLAPTVEIFDPELDAADNYANATLSLARDSGPNPDDLFDSTGNLVFNSGASGTLELSSVPIGTYTLSGGVLDITFNNNATSARVNEALKSVTYHNINNDPPDTVNIEWIFNDRNTGAQGTGWLLSDSGTTVVNIVAANDDPFTGGVIPTSVTVQEDTLSPVDLSAFHFTDADAGTEDVTVRLSTSTGGELTLFEDGVVSITGNSTNIVELTGTLDELNDYFDQPGNIQYLHSISHRAGNSADQIAVSINDNGHSGAGGGTDQNLAGIIVHILPINDPPLWQFGASNQATFVEDGTAVILDNDVIIFDQEQTPLDNFSGASLSIARAGGANFEDVFNFRVGHGITIAGSNLIKNGQSIGTLNFATGQVLFTFHDTNGEIPTSADVKNIMQSILYANISEDPPPQVQLDWTFSDGNTGTHGTDLNLQTVGSTFVNISSINDRPELISPAIEAIAAYDFEDGTASIAPAGPQITVDGPARISSTQGFTTGLNGLYFPTGVFTSANNPVSLGSIPNVATIDEFSFSAQVRFDAGAGDRAWERVFDFGGGSQQDNGLLTRGGSSDDLVFQAYSGAILVGEIVVPNALNGIEGGWHHYGVTIDPVGLAKLYIDGAIVGATQLIDPPDYSTWDENYIGSSNWNNNKIFQGAMDDIAIFDREVSASEMAALANTTTPQDFTVPENSANGATAATIHGGDAEDDFFTYNITSQEHAGAFTINTVSGEITVADSSLLDADVDDSHDITVSVFGGGLFSQYNYQISIADAVNIQHSVPAALDIDEDDVLTFSNNVTVSDGLAAGDALLRVTLNTTNGVLDLAGLTGITVIGGADGSSSMTIVGIDTNINNALNGMTFTPDADYNGVVSLDIATADVTSALDSDAQLVGRYTFENGQALDYSPGTPQNAVFIGDANTTIDPQRGEVLTLDGDGDSVEISGLFTQSENATLAAWVNLTSTASNAELISLGNNLVLRLDGTGANTNGIALIHRFAGNWHYSSSNEFIAGNGWNHVAATFDDTNDTIKIYLNGTEILSESTSRSIDYDMDTNTVIGAHSNMVGLFDFNGQIDDARIYSRALTDTEIAELASPTGSNLVTATSLPEVISSVPITVNPVNDDPFNTGSLPADVVVTEDVLSPIDLSLIDLADVDAGSGDITIALYTSTGGRLTLLPDASLVFGGTDTQRTVTGTLASLNAYFDNATSVQYLHAVPDISGDNIDSITVVVNDGGNSGAGGAANQILGVVNIDITGTNDTPALVQVDLEAVAAYDFESGTASTAAVGPPISASAPVVISGADGISTGESGLLFPAGDNNSSIHPVSISTVPGVASSNEFSFSARIRFDTGIGDRAWERVFDFGDGSVAKYVALSRYGTTNELVLEVDNGTWSPDEIVVSNALDSIMGQWHHYGVTIDSSGVAQVYIDGVRVASEQLSLLPDYTAFTNNYLGSSQFTGNKRFQGAMDDIAIFDRALTSSEMGALGSTFTPQNFTLAEIAVDGSSAGFIHGGDAEGDALSYSIPAQEHAGAFAIDVNTGEVTVANSTLLDFESDHTHAVIIRASDGVLFDEETYTITLTDAAEVQQSVPVSQVIDEDNVLNFGNSVSVQDGLASDDALLRVQLDITDGVLNLSGMAGIAVVDGADGSSSLTIVGTDTDINNALNGMTFTPDAHYNGNVSLEVNSSIANLKQLAGRYTYENGLATDVSSGLPQDGVLIADATTVVDPVRGEVLSLDGVGDKVEIPGIFGEPENLTLSAWVNLASMSGDGAEVVSLGNNVHLRLDASSSGNGIVLVYRNGGAWHTLTTGVFVAGTGWNHVAATFDTANDTQTIYLNGSAIHTSYLSDSIEYDVATNTIIGAHGDGAANYNFNGTIDDVRIYTRALSAVEVAELASPSEVIASVLQSSSSVPVTVNAVNDDPYNAGSLPAVVTVTEDVMSGIDLSSVEFADVDAGAGYVTVSLSTDTGGELTLAPDAALTFGGTAAAATVTGTLAELNTYFNNAGSVQYMHGATHTNGANADTISVSISDNGNTGSGFVTAQFLGTVNADITAVNNEQVVATNTGIAVVEGSTGNVITAALLETTDIDHTAAQLLYAVDALPDNGTLNFSGVALAVNDTFTQADIDAGLISYDHDGSQTSSDTFVFSVDDGVGTESSGTFSITVNNVNDAPVNTVPAGPLTLDEDTSFSISGISVTDDDANLDSVRLTVSNGRLAVTLSGGTSVVSGANGSADLTLVGSLADINATLSTVSYQGNAHYNGAEALTILSTDDSGGTDSDTVTITVNPINDVPFDVGTLPTAVTVAEDVLSVIDLSSVEFGDVDAGTSDVTVRLSTSTGGELTLVPDASLTFGGTAIERTVTGTLAQLNAYFDNAGSIQYLYGSAHTNGVNADTLTVTITDNGHTGSGGGVVQVLGTVNVDITAVNDEQVVATNAGITVTEGSTGNVITAALLETTDVDHTAVQLLYKVDALPDNGALNFSGVALEVNDTFTQTDIDAGLISYDHDGSQTASDAFVFSVDDGVGTESSGTFDITISNVNDTPVNTVPAGPLAVDEDSPLAITGISVADDDDNLATVRLMVNSGSLNVILSGTTSVYAGSNGSADLTLAGSLSDINNTLGSLSYQGDLHFNGADSLTVISTDDSSATSSDVIGIIVNPINDDPVNTGTLVSDVIVTEDLLSALDLSAVDFQDIDAVSDILTVTVSTAAGGELSLAADTALVFDGTPTARTITGLLSDLNAYFDVPDSIQYLHSTANFNGENADTVSVYINDNGNTGAGGGAGGGADLLLGTVNIVISAVNDEQLLTANTGATVAEGSTGNAISSALLQTTDVDHAPEQLIYTVTAVPSNGMLLLNGTVLAVNDTFTQADIDAGVISYDHDGSQTLSDAFGFSVNDGTGTVSTGTFNIGVNNVNDAPVNSVPAGPLAVDEDLPLAITGVSVTDDDDNLSTVRLMVNNGTLNVILSGTASVAAGSNGSSDLTLAGSVADINDTLASLSYQGYLHFNGADALTVISTDISLATTSDIVTITVNPVNDDPVNSGTLPGAVTVIEDVLSDVDLSGVDFNDVDAGASNLTVRLSTLTGGELTLASDASLIFAGTPTGSTITGQLSDLNAYFNNIGNIQYLHNTTNINGNNVDTIRVVINDNGNTGSGGGDELLLGTINVDISAVNDEQVLARNTGATVAEGVTGFIITPVLLQSTDIDHTPEQLIYTVTSAPANGTLLRSGTALAVPDTFTQADINAGVVNYDHDGSQTPSDAFGFSVDDGAGTVSTGNFKFTISNVNDAPVLSVPGPLSVDEDMPLAIPGISVTDEDDNLSTVRLVVNSGTLNVTLSGTASLSAGSNGSSDLTLAGSLADINDTLASLSYQGYLHFNGADTLTVLSTDDNLAITSDVVTITINPTNDDPVNSGTLPSAVTVVEDVLSDVDLSGVDFGDVDAGASNLTVSLSTDTGGQLTLAANASLAFGGTATNSTISGTLTALNAYFNNAGNIQYLHSTRNINGDNVDTIFVTINDNGNTGSGGGTDHLIGTVNIDISAVNDEQVLAANIGATVAEGSTGNTITTARLQTTDVDHTPEQLFYTVTAGSDNGTLLLSGTALAVSDTFTQTDINSGVLTYDHDGSQTSADAFSFSVDDGTGTVSIGNFDFTISNVNDEPVNSVPGPLTVDEDTPLVITGVSVADDDDNLATVRLYVNSGTLNVTLSGTASVSAGSNGSSYLTLAGPLADINDTLASLRYQGNLHFNGADTLTVLSTDSSLATASDVVTITVNAVNDDPVNPGTLPSAVTVTEDVLSDVDLSGVDFSDVDAGAGNVTVALSTVTGGELTLAPDANLIFAETPTASTISGQLSDLNAYFNNPGNIQYLHGTTNINGNNVDTITVTINDNGNTGSGGGADLLLGTINVDISAVNDEQVLAHSTGATVAEGATGFIITPVLLQSTDIDHTPEQLIYTVTAAPANGKLLLSGTTLALSDTFTQADINAGVVTYDHNGSQTASDAFGLTVDDGTGSVSSGAFVITISNVNDAPVISVPGPLSVDEDTLLAITGITVADDDDNLSTVRLLVNSGTLNVTLSGTASVSNGSNGSSDLTLAGSLADINETLASLNYQGNLHFNGADTLTIQSIDSSLATTSDVVTITVNPVNDDPVHTGTLPSTVTVMEDVLSDVDLSGVDFSDIDAGASSLTVSLSTATGGQLMLAEDANLSFNGPPEARTITGSLTELNAYFNNPGNIQYLHRTDHINGENADRITVVIDDDTSSSVDNNQMIGTVNVTITAVNDSPSLNTFNLYVDEGHSAVVSSEEIQATDIDDLGPDDLHFAITSLPASGVLTLDGVPIATGTSFSAGELRGASLRYIHDGSETAEDHFNIQVLDGGEDSAEPAAARLNIAINEVIDPAPIAVDESITLAYGESFSTIDGDLLESGSTTLAARLIVQQPELVVSLETAPLHGTVTVSADGTFTYSHDGNALLQDSFQFRVTNIDGEFAIANVNITIEPPIDFAIEENQKIGQAFVPVTRQAESPPVPQQSTPVSIVPTATEAHIKDLQNLFSEAEQRAILSTAEEKIEVALFENTERPNEIVSIQELLEDRQTVVQHKEQTTLSLQDDAITVSSDYQQELIQPNLGIDGVRKFTSSENFNDALWQIEKNLTDAEEKQNRRYQVATNTSLGISLGLTAGIFSWFFRGGALLASVVASTPLWSYIDPVSIITKKSEEKTGKKPTERETDELEKYFDGKL